MRYAAPELAGVADAIRSIEAARFHHPIRRRRGCLAARRCAGAKLEQNLADRVYRTRTREVLRRVVRRAREYGYEGRATEGLARVGFFSVSMERRGELKLFGG